MTTRMDDLSDAAVETAEGDVARLEAPDFAAVLARAQGIRAEEDRESVVELPPEPEQDEVVLRPFVVAAIAVAERDVATMILTGPPEEPARPSSRWKWIVGVGAAVLAAAAVLFFAAPAGWSLRQQAEDRDASQAVSLEAAGAEPEPFETKRVVPPKPTPKKVERAPVPEEEIAIEPAPPKPAPESIDDKLKRLDALAERQLGDGQMDAADRTLSQLIEIGGKRRLVELAFGDRFTIAHRRGDATRQVALWQSYLRRFPKGRLADDARAGLCRHAAEKRRGQCWGDYLRDFPRGAYSEQARREAGPDAP